MPTLAEQIIPRRKLLLIASELVILAGVVFFGTALPPLGGSRPFDLFAFDSSVLRGVLSSITIALLCQAALSYNDLYDWKVSQNRAELPNRLLHSAGYALVMIAIVVFVLPAPLFHFPGLQDASRETWKLLLLLAFGFTLIYAWRYWFHWFFYKWNFGERIVILGLGPRAHDTARLIMDNPMAGYEVIGLVGDPSTDEEPPRVDCELDVLGTTEILPSLGETQRVARVIVALEERRGHLPVDELLRCRMRGMEVEEPEAMYERLTGRIAVESLRPSYLIFGRGFTKSRLAIAIKRTIDIVVSLIGLVLSSPLWLLAAIVIRLDSPGPILFRQTRVGQDGEEFTILKLRTMRNDAERNGPQWASKNDARVTRIGKTLRMLRIDEIPQMLNVLAGHMSFVGPRPERPHFTEELSREIPYYPLRLTVKPGLTGWAQVNMPYGASVEDAAEKLRYELYYIKNMGPLFDLNIILRTVGVILFGKGAR